MKSQSSTTWVALGVIAAGVVMRLLPHPANVTPLAALALVGGTIFPDRRWALLVPLAAIIASDLWLGFHVTIPFTWGSVVLIGLIGLWVRRQAGWTRLIVGSVLGSTLFFVITNFGVWWLGHGQWYPRTWAGLLDCYAAGIPFYRQTLVGDLGYAFLLFGTYHLAAARLQRSAAVAGSST